MSHFLSDEESKEAGLMSFEEAMEIAKNDKDMAGQLMAEDWLDKYVEYTDIPD